MLLELRVGEGEGGRREGQGRERVRGQERVRKRMKGRQCDWQSRLEPGWDQGGLGIQSWKLDGTGSGEPMKVLSRGVASSQEGVPGHFQGGCNKKLGFPTPSGHEPSGTTRQQTFSHPLSPALHHSHFSVGPQHPQNCSADPPFAQLSCDHHPCVCLPSGPRLLLEIAPRPLPSWLGQRLAFLPQVALLMGKALSGLL